MSLYSCKSSVPEVGRGGICWPLLGEGEDGGVPERTVAQINEGNQSEPTLPGLFCPAAVKDEQTTPLVK